MKALTLTQPWATLVALRYKRIETRSWSTRYRGPLAIHAAKGLPKGLRRGDTMELGPFEVERDAAGLLLRGPTAWPYRLPLGAVVTVVDLIGVERITRGIGDHDEDVYLGHVKAGPAQGLELELGDYRSGRYGWLLGSAWGRHRALASWLLDHPQPATGHLGLWEWDADGAFDRAAKVADFAHKLRQDIAELEGFGSAPLRVPHPSFAPRAEAIRVDPKYL